MRIELLTGYRSCPAFRPHGGWRSGQMYDGLARIEISYYPANRQQELQLFKEDFDDLAEDLHLVGIGNDGLIIGILRA